MRRRNINPNPIILSNDYSVQLTEWSKVSYMGASFVILKYLIHIDMQTWLRYCILHSNGEEKDGNSAADNIRSVLDKWHVTKLISQKWRLHCNLPSHLTSILRTVVSRASRLFPYRQDFFKSRLKWRNVQWIPVNNNLGKELLM